MTSGGGGCGGGWRTTGARTAVHGGDATATAVASTCSRDLSDEWRGCCSGVLFPGLVFDDGIVAVAGPARRGVTLGRVGDCHPCQNFDGDEDNEVPVINLLDLPDEEQVGDSRDDRGVQRSDCDDVVDGGAVGGTDSDGNWYDNAALLDESIAEVAHLLRRKGRDYADCDFRLSPNDDRGGEGEGPMTEAEKLLLETTVMSFAASTTTQIDLLRRQQEELRKRHHHGDEDEHRGGIVAVLLHRLKRDVALPMERLQKIRRREANVARRNPLTCRAAPETAAARRPKQRRPADMLLDDDEEYDEEERHRNGRREVIAAAMEAASTRLWTDRVREEEEDFCAAYFNDELLDADADAGEGDVVGDGDGDGDGPMKRQKTQHEAAAKGEDGFLPVVENVEYNTTYHEFEKKGEEKRREEQARRQQQQQPHEFAQDGGGDAAMDYDPQYMEDLRAEHLLLEAQYADGELENVQRIEERMVEITTLLNRFADLISEQREDVLVLHENTKSSAENMEKGQDKLEDARERGKKSQHYMAKIIVFLAILLLFLNWVTP